MLLEIAIAPETNGCTNGISHSVTDGIAGHWVLVITNVYWCLLVNIAAPHILVEWSDLRIIHLKSYKSKSSTSIFKP